LAFAFKPAHVNKKINEVICKFELMILLLKNI